MMHEFFVCEFIEGKQAPRHNGDSFDKAMMIYDGLMDASFMATRGDRAIVSRMKREGKTRTVIY
jgi:hypothetical protein